MARTSYALASSISSTWLAQNDSPKLERQVRRGTSSSNAVPRDTNYD